jgi:beta-lactamase regulating signal transducer with metallopeptidase domain/protocatechuate 3,4-dioxygenase beta subunit
MPQWLIDSIDRDVDSRIIADVVARATILLCVTAAIAMASRRWSAAVRHRLWCLALGSLLVLPLLSLTLPGWQLPVPPAMLGSPGITASGAKRENHQSPGALQPLPPGLGREYGELGIGRQNRGADFASRPSSTAAGPLRNVASRRAIDALILLWALGFLAVALPAVVSLIGNEWRRRRSPLVADAAWLESLDVLSGQLAIRCPVELRMCGGPQVPVTWGFWRPVILLPVQASAWSEGRRRLVLLHELGHIKRGDVGFQVIARMAAAFYWFHPLVWYALHRSRIECECACDDHVVHAGGLRTAYATELVDLARDVRSQRLTAALPMTRANSLEQRIRALFEDRRSHQPLSRSSGRALLAGISVVLLSVTVVHPEPSSGARLQDNNPPGAPTITNAAAGPKSPAKSDPALPKTYTHPISLTGRATDINGKPVAGARVYLTSQRGDYKRIAETATNGEGRYEFHDVPLPIERADTLGSRDEGAFQVIGQAKGFGFAWRPLKWFFPRPRPANITHEFDPRDPPSRYEASDKIVLDLRFPPAAHLSGTIFDDRGNPIAGARLEIRGCESLVAVDNVIAASLDSLNDRDSVPPSMKIRVTDAKGRFDFTDLPPDCLFRIDVRAKNFPWRWVHAATTQGPQSNRDGAPVLTGEMKVTLATPLDIPIQIVYGDTLEPAPKAAVQAAAGDVSILETTDQQGRVTLRLPPGKYRMENWPARGTPYLVTPGELVLGSNPPTDPVVMSLRRGALIDVTVVDAETGEGIANVDLWEQTGPNGQREQIVVRSWEVATRIARRDHPRTDVHGKLSALVEPGGHRVGVGWYSHPPELIAVQSPGQDVQCRVGETVRLNFSMKRRR